MADNLQRSRGRSSNYKFDAGGMPTDFGPFIGEVMNNVDPTRSGRLQVWIEQFAGADKTNRTMWRTVSYVSPQAGASPKSSTSAGTGTFGNNNNQMSYGQTAPVPDVGVQVLCYFVSGDPTQGFYTGFIQSQGMNHMTPAIGATKTYATQNTNQSTYFAKSPQLPVIEINNDPKNTAIVNNPKFFDQQKPVHSYLASIMFQQGLVNDPIRGPITSSAARESPSNVTGQSTPGRPIYQGDIKDTNIESKVAAGNLTTEDAKVVGRIGGHSMVMDDGDQTGKNSLIRFRTSKGHQITMSDDANCFYIAHSNGQVWLEFGQEVTVDVYSTNSINLRSSGTVNIHADKDINMFAGGNINMKSNVATTLQSEGSFVCANKGEMTLYSELNIGVKANGTLALSSQQGAWNGGGGIALDASYIDLNSGLARSSGAVKVPQGLTEYTMPDTEFNASAGWNVSSTGLKSIVTRAPAHEPWPYHNQGVQVKVDLGGGTTPPPGAPTLPTGTTITKTN